MKCDAPDCRAIEFTRITDDWRCSNGHPQNWFVLTDEQYAERYGDPA